MGKKSKLYLLVVINLIAWGYVGYKVYSVLQDDDEVNITYDTPKINKIDSGLSKDSIHLNLNYNDPFLKSGNFSEKRKSINVATDTRKQITTSVKQTNIKSVTTPSIQTQIDIKYLGLVKNNTTGAVTALLNLNSKSIFVSVNSTIEGYIVKQILSDKVILVKGKETLEIKK